MRVKAGVGQLIKCIATSLDSETDRRLSVHGLTSPQHSALFQLQQLQQPPCSGRTTASELARALAVDAGAMTRMLDRLERKKLIARSRTTEDRRVVHIELTPQGHAVIAESWAAPADALDAHLAGFTPTECGALQEYLNRMLINGRDGRCHVRPAASSQRMCP